MGCFALFQMYVNLWSICCYRQWLTGTLFIGVFGTYFIGADIKAQKAIEEKENHKVEEMQSKGGEAERLYSLPWKIYPKDLLEMALIFIVTMIALNMLIKSVFVYSHSMVPTLKPGDYLIVYRLNFLLEKGQVNRGDVVVFRAPILQNSMLVKRVIGLPGDQIRLDSSGLYINGLLYEEDYLLEPAIYKPFEIDVPPGRYFLMGDNRNISQDSRYFGTVPHHVIIGKPIFSFWPINRVGKITPEMGDFVATN